MPTMSPSRKGMRQPQDSNAEVDMLAAKTAPTAEPSKMPAPAPHAASAPIKPRRPSRAFDQEHHRTGIFAANRKSLQHAQQRERGRRQEAQRRISRQQSDQESRDRHGRD